MTISHSLLKAESGYPLPSDNFIDKGLLLAGSSAEIDTGCFDAFMSHEVGKQSNVIVLFKKILGVAMTERVRIDHLLIQTVLDSIVLELLRNATGRDALTISIEKQITGGTVCFLQPCHSLRSELFRYVKPPQFSAFSVKVEVADFDVFNLYLNQFTNSCTGSSQIPYNEIPFHVAVFLELFFKKL